MTERRENIARALWEAVITKWDVEPWDEQGEELQDEYRRLADAAIAADDGAVRRVLAPFEELFASGPDTACRTTWRRGLPGPGIHRTSTECVEVPKADLRVAFDAARAAVGAPATAEDGEL